MAHGSAASRSVLRTALDGDLREVEEGVAEEERRERESDRAYWRPLSAELEALRRAR